MQTKHTQTNKLPNMGYLLCSALSLDTSPPPLPSPSLPTARICLLMAWQISLAAAIWAFSPSSPPRVARRAKETQRREYTASTCVCVARWCATSSSTCDRKVAKLRSSHWPPSVVTNTTYAWGWRGEGNVKKPHGRETPPMSMEPIQGEKEQIRYCYDPQWKFQFSLSKTQALQLNISSQTNCGVADVKTKLWYLMEIFCKHC